ncbi:Hypothetical predicted protein [Mytilus galloprovincialis]|uniref:VWFD domain-containing protein n=2 Tax=Mytilus galloprovincialis TaxID=29158 RepID=A0A8B6DJ09_MYTGA|nr:Hypothetical predicted protein [Mytilus galloprovincialis]
MIRYTSASSYFKNSIIEKTSFIVKSGEEVKINIKSTVPVACLEFPGLTRCNIDIELFSLQDQIKSRPANCNDSLSDDIIENSRSSCGLAFNGTAWDKYQTFTLRTLGDQAVRSSYTCTAKLIAKSTIDSLWKNFQLPEVSIHVLNKHRPKGKCYSRNDPHLRTIDGRYFSTHDTGEFVLFRHKTKPIEIHTIQRRDDRRKWASNCAVLFRASTDMFVIYGCNKPTRWIARRLNCDRAHQYLEVLEKGTNFEVIMPTGTRIVVLVNKYWLNVYIYVSAMDWEETEGLCGLYNGRSNDDFTDMKGNIVDQAKLMSSWRVPGSRSLFIAKARSEKMKTEVMYCTCYNESRILEIQEEIKETADCTWKDSLPLCKPKNWKENTCRNYGRTKREISDDFEFDVPIDVVAFRKGPQEFKWENGWTEQKAINACASYFEKSKLFNLCSKITKSSGVDRTTCVADIKLSGSTVFLSASLDSMKTACINEIRLNTSFWKPKPEPKLHTTTEKNLKLNVKTQPTTTTTTARSLEILENEDISILDIAETVFNNDCPNDCSESGICQQGICDCDEGFEGEDCSVDRRIGPELFGLVEESFCDLSKRPCSFISVFGNGFYESDRVKCRIMEAQIVQYEVKPNVRNVTTDGSLITFAEVKCPLEQMDVSKSPNFPVLDAYLVAVSFDEIKYSTGSPIIVYDSTCTICKNRNGTVDCKMRDDVCIVERKCYNQEHNMCKPSTTLVPRKQTTISEIIYETSEQTTDSEIIYETSEQTTNSEILYKTSEQTTRSDIMYETSIQTTSSEELYESSKQTTSVAKLYETSKQTIMSEKLYETSKQTTSSEELYEPSKQTTTTEILYKHSKQTASPDITYEISKPTTMLEKPYEPSEQTTSLDILYETSIETTSSDKLYKPSKQTISSEKLDEPNQQTSSSYTLYEPSKETTSSEKLYEHSNQSISPEILYLGAAVGGLAIVVVPTLLLIRRWRHVGTYRLSSSM